MAVCYDLFTFGENGSDAFPICEEHALLKTRWWKLLPLPGVSIDDSHNLVIQDNLHFGKIIPDVVTDSIKSAYNFSVANQILNELKYDHLNRNFYFYRHEMYVGVEEKDGYIHT
jgi:hypothetical protein